MTGIAAIRYEFPAATRSVRELAAAGLLHSSPETLETLGFEQVRVACDESAYSLALRASTSLLEEHDIDPDSIGLLVYGGAPAALAFAPANALVDAAGDTANDRAVPLSIHSPAIRAGAGTRLGARASTSSRARRCSAPCASRGRSASPRASSAHSASRRTSTRRSRAARRSSTARPTPAARCSSSEAGRAIASWPRAP